MNQIQIELSLNTNYQAQPYIQLTIKSSRCLNIVRYLKKNVNDPNSGSQAPNIFYSEDHIALKHILGDPLAA